MLLGRRLLRLSAAVSGGVRRSLTTAASRPPWAMVRFSSEVVGAPSVDVRLAEPPHVSEIRVPGHLIKTSGSAAAADPDSRIQNTVCATSDGLLLLTYLDLRLTASIVRKQGDRRVHRVPDDLDPGQVSSVTRFVCNPVTGELSRLPDSICSLAQEAVCGPQMGFITQADGGHGPPHRFSAARLGGNTNTMVRFLSETGDWEIVEFSPFRFPLARLFNMGQEPLAFGGRLWWVDVTCGAVTADPFSDRPELSFVQLPRQSMLPESAQDQGTISYRRMGVSEGRLRYVEVSQEEPFLLSSFVLDDQGSSWTLEHQVVLNKIWARSTCIPLQMSGDTDIVLIDPRHANVVYLMVMSQIVVVDMEREEVIESCMCSSHSSCIPCVLPPWLGSSRIPSAGKKDVEKNMTLADFLVRSDGYYKR